MYVSIAFLYERVDACTSAASVQLVIPLLSSGVSFLLLLCFVLSWRSPTDGKNNDLAKIQAKKKKCKNFIIFPPYLLDRVVMAQSRP